MPADLRGVTVALWGEQGIGDEVLFLRYLPQLKARGPTVVYQTGNANLLPLLKQWQSQGYIDDLLASDTPVVQGAVRLLIGDLPFALGATDATDYPPPLRLSAEPAAIQSLQQHYPILAGLRPRIRLTWRAGVAQPKADAHGNRWLSKTISLTALVALLVPLDVDVVILQRKPQLDELAWVQAQLGSSRCMDASAFDQDLSELMALLSTLDGLVGVSNTNVHLMAALGKGGDILVPAPSEFRWQETGSVSSGFVNFRVWRQDQDGDWAPALAALQAGLKAKYTARV